MIPHVQEAIENKERGYREFAAHVAAGIESQERIRLVSPASRLPIRMLRIRERFREAMSVFSDWRTDRRRRHVEALAREHSITVVWGSTPFGGTAWPTQTVRVVYLPTGRDGLLTDALYAVALHEIGHIVSPAANEPGLREDKYDDGMPMRPLSEPRAWRWAREHAQPRWTMEMQRELDDSLGTYVRYATPEELLEFAAEMTPDPRSKVTLYARIARGDR